MTRPLSHDLRTRLIAAVEGGQSRRAAAKRFGVAASTAIKWLERWRCEGQAVPRRMGGDRHAHRLEAHAAAILALVAAKPDITLAEIAAHLEAAQGLRASPSAVWRLLDRHGLTFKKNSARRRAATAGRAPPP
jgi:transposase